jgi:hypothetical protein
MKKKILVLGIVLALITALAVPMAVLAASNDSSQEASTTQSTSIEIRATEAVTQVATITFPQGAPSAIISSPYNDVEGTGDPQVLSATISEPVVRLYNGSGGALNVTLDITGWTGSVVASERYELVATGTVDVNSVATTLSSDGTAATVATGQSIATTVYMDLYLEVTLGAGSGASGSSTLTILGES